MSLHPSIAAVRRPVRATLEQLEPGEKVVVACSGGADSLALASAAIFEGHKLGLHVIGATVDHGMQGGSAAQAEKVVAQLAEMGVDETVTATVEVKTDGDGPEAAARQARYAVLDQLAERLGASVILLGHTRDDQAETVLLGLTRGSGARSLSGMRASFDRYRRPLLATTRTDTETACQVEGIDVWNDPHNRDFAYTRARIRHRVLPVLEEHLGPGVTDALARTAEQLREDADFIDDIAEAMHRELDGTLPVGVLAQYPAAVRTRVLRIAALEAGSPAAELTREHVKAVEALVTGWRGQRWIDLPGHIRALRTDSSIVFESGPSPTSI
ncbi:tRNA(Ile)-lysidine synthase [Nocardioides luteus]|uniref:tRNA(Ile)-lysidine synthase n=1 Tax=Nocardioides luteus TaxID=1844 RepID=A0ABQ5SXR7_9ACTN|nr:tRNA lysidine(34) synthetase TilS [Nocardioides luteus]MDR7312715.1 tRNA(Ile)-lysidine synthase [Nocardioides luteus]GGR47071.1 tRNA(Ile)-lysidine synthase [Nocardioides luteus]GLJ68968.1 tRNA(Ile)-lysidine synthase [Nocardioides luteus]